MCARFTNYIHIPSDKIEVKTDSIPFKNISLLQQSGKILVSFFCNPFQHLYPVFPLALLQLIEYDSYGFAVRVTDRVNFANLGADETLECKCTVSV